MRNRSVEEWYSVLGIRKTLDRSIVKQAFKDSIAAWHPDRFPPGSERQNRAEERVKEINRAYEEVEKYLECGPSLESDPDDGSEEGSDYPDTNEGVKEDSPDEEETATRSDSRSHPGNDAYDEARDSADRKSPILIVVGIAFALVLLLFLAATLLQKIPDSGSSLPTTPAPTISQREESNSNVKTEETDYPVLKKETRQEPK